MQWFPARVNSLWPIATRDDRASVLSEQPSRSVCLGLATHRPHGAARVGAEWDPLWLWPHDLCRVRLETWPERVLNFYPEVEVSWMAG